MVVIKNLTPAELEEENAVDMVYIHVYTYHQN